MDPGCPKASMANALIPLLLAQILAYSWANPSRGPWLFRKNEIREGGRKPSKQLGRLRRAIGQHSPADCCVPLTATSRTQDDQHHEQAHCDTCRCDAER